MTDIKIEDVTNRLSMNLGSAVWSIVMAGPTELEKLNEAIGHIKEQLLSASLIGRPGDDLANEWGEKVYALAAQLNENRQNAVEWICRGSSRGLQYAIDYLEREIEELKK